MPGCGKSTLGRALARSVDLQFIDLDHYIEGRFSCSVSDIFSRQGEERFRTIEHNLLHEVAEMDNVVVSCGGGTPCFFDNMEYMLSRGTVIYLVPERDRLHERLCKGRNRRPAVAQLSDSEIYDYIDKTLEERTPVYRRAHLCLESTHLEDKKSIRITVDKCLQSLNQYILLKKL